MSVLQPSRYCFIIILLFTACKSSEEFSGFSYDPPDVTNTKDKPIRAQKKRVIGVDNPKIWISNEFDGARVTDFFMREDSSYEVTIEPENSPINNSPWYAFRIWSDKEDLIPVYFTYPDGQHRYRPKMILQKDLGKMEYAFLPVRFDSSVNKTLVYIPVGRNTSIVSAQPLQTSDMLIPEMKKRAILGPDFSRLDTVGFSKERRPVLELTINDTKYTGQKPVLVILSRQHPPEVTGYLGALSALKAIAADDSLSRKFRDTFVIKAYPMLNPDGVDNGHWRHNSGGVDLNRDWGPFNQTETASVRDAVLRIKENPEFRLMYAIDYHSTNENIFYPILSEVRTNPDNITQEWIPLIQEGFPELTFAVEEFDTSSPISKNWFYSEFGIDALTYEIDDGMPVYDLDRVSSESMKHLMSILLKKWATIQQE